MFCFIFTLQRYDKITIYVNFWAIILHKSLKKEKKRTEEDKKRTGEERSTPPSLCDTSPVSGEERRRGLPGEGFWGRGRDNNTSKEYG